LYEGVKQVDKIEHSAHFLLSILLRIFIAKDKNNQDFAIFKAIVTLLQKLDKLKDNEGQRILQNFLNENKNRYIISNVYTQLLDGLLTVSN
jgi:hypothetical protein